MPRRTRGGERIFRDDRMRKVPGVFSEETQEFDDVFRNYSDNIDPDQRSPALANYANERSRKADPDQQIKEVLRETGGIDENGNLIDEDKLLQQDPEGRDEESPMLMRAAQGVWGVGVQLTAGAAASAIQELGNTALDLAEWTDNFLSKQGLGSGDTITNERMDFANDIVGAPDNMAESLARSVGQFLIPFAGGMRVVTAGRNMGKMANMARGMSVGAAVDFAAFDPHEERLSDLIQRQPHLANPINQYLQSGEDETALEGRFKQALEGMALGGLAEGMFLAVRGYRQSRRAKAAIDQDNVRRKTGQVKEDPTQGIDETGRSQPVDESAAPAETPRSVRERSPSDNPVDDPSAQPREEPSTEAKSLNEATEKPLETLDEGVFPRDVPESEFVDSTPLKPPKRPLTEVDPATGRVKSNPDQVRTSEDIDKIIEAKIKSRGRNIDVDVEDARRGTISDDELRQFADEMGMNPQEIMNRRKGQPIVAEELWAMRDTQREFSDWAFQSIRDAAEDPQNLAKQALALDSLNAYMDVFAKTSGAAGEAGRALRVLRVAPEGASEQYLQRLIRGEIESFGGHADTSEMMSKIQNMLSNSSESVQKSLNKLSRRKSKGKRITDAVHEAWIGSLLSNPATTVMNWATSIGALGMQIGEAQVAARIIGPIRDGIGVNIGSASQRVSIQEADAMLHEAMASISEGFRFAGKAFRGEMPPAHLSKVDLGQTGIGGPQRSLSAENLDLEGTAGLTADFLGKMTSVGVRSIMAGDAFVRTIGYRSKVHGMAVRDAHTRGLRPGSDAWNQHVKNVLNDPPDNIHYGSQKFSKEATFTDQLEGVARDLQGIRDKIPGLRYLFPFWRTNVNLIKFAGERTPGVNMLVGRSKKRLFSPNRAEQDTEIAKLALGTAMGGIGFGLAQAGILRGSGPQEPNARRIWLQDNQPSSIRVGDTDINFGRFAPFALTFGVAADMAELYAMAVDEDKAMADDMAGAALAMMTRYFTPELLTQEVSGVLEMVAEPEGSLGRYTAQKISSMVVPMSGLMREGRKYIDPTIRDTMPDPQEDFELWQRIVSEVKNSIPGLSKDLPPRRNLFGEPIHYPVGVGFKFGNPLHQASRPDSPALRELTELGLSGPVINVDMPLGEDAFQIRMPERVQRKQVGPPGMGINARFELSHEQYDRYVMLAAGHDLGDPFRRAAQGSMEKDYPSPSRISTLRETLDDMVRKDFRGMLPDGMRKNPQARLAIMKNVISKYRKAARQQLRAEFPDIIEAFREQEMARFEVLGR